MVDAAVSGATGPVRIEVSARMRAHIPLLLPRRGRKGALCVGRRLAHLLVELKGLVGPEKDGGREAGQADACVHHKDGAVIHAAEEP